MKRFKVRNTDRYIVFNADTTRDCYDFLLTQDMGLNSFMVECNVDDIEINGDDFIESFKCGDCPVDLQYF